MSKIRTFSLFNKDNVETVAEFIPTVIGTIDQENGDNKYILLQRYDDILTIDQAKQFVEYHYFYETNVPGGAFCRSCSIVHQQYSDDTVIVTLYRRFDI
jgi:hypothetical protein